MKRASLIQFQEFRHKKMLALEDNKLSEGELADSIFGFIIKNHVKPVSKPKNRQQLLLNYFYWLTFTERKVVMEKHLIKLGLGTEEDLMQSVGVYVKRRDKMIVKLLSELKEVPKEIIKISKDFYEVVLSDGCILLASDEAIKELKVSETRTGDSTFPSYMNVFIDPYLP